MNWLKKSQFQQFQVDEEEQYYELTRWLVELYKMEYAIGELKRRLHINPRLQYWAQGRVKHWIQQLYDRSLPLALKAGEEMLESLDHWLDNHTPSGFTRMIMGDEEEWEQSAISPEGIISLGGGFRFNLMEHTLEPFLRDNEWFVNSIWQEELVSHKEWMDPEEFQEQGFESWDDEQILQHVQEQITDIYPTWDELEAFLGQHVSFDRAVARVIAQQVYPAWREFWGSLIETAEENITKARERLADDLQSQDINNLFISINAALNAQHVHGNMAEHMPLDYKTLEYLSNLETEEIDEFCDMVTGENWKTAERTRNWLEKIVF